MFQPYRKLGALTWGLDSVPRGSAAAEQARYYITLPCVNITNSPKAWLHSSNTPVTGGRDAAGNALVTNSLVRLAE